MSLFDQPKPQLNPILWDSTSKTLKPEVKEYLLNLLQQIFPLSKVAGLTMIGSNVSYQYSEISDIDISVMVPPGADTYDKWHPVFKEFNDRTNMYPGTKHQINFMFQEYIPKEAWDNSLGAYDILNQVWIKYPIPFDKAMDPQKKYVREIAYGNMLIHMINAEVLAMGRAQESGQKEEARRIARSLSTFFKGLEDNRKLAYRYGTGTPALQECNILYKMFEASAHGELMHKLIAAYDSLHPAVKEMPYGRD